MITRTANEWASRPPRYSSPELAPSTPTHNTRRARERSDHHTEAGAERPTTTRRAIPGRFGVAANAPTSSEAARVSVPMYTRVGSTPSYSSTIARTTAPPRHRQDHQRAHRPARPPPDRHQHHRPQQIELLLDGQTTTDDRTSRAARTTPSTRPTRQRSANWRRRAPPTGHRLHTRQSAQAAEQPRPQRHDHDHHNTAGSNRRNRRPQNDPRRTPPGGGVTDQQRRDQEPRQGEEQIDTEEPALQVATVEQQHRHHGGRTQAVERRDVLPP